MTTFEEEFEKDFPSFKEQRYSYGDSSKSGLTIELVDVQKYCRDIEKIKLAIEAMVHGVEGPDKILIECVNYLYQELDLK